MAADELGVELDLHLPHVHTSGPNEGGARPYTRREPLHGRNGSYPHPKTTEGMQAWRMAWLAAGGIRLEVPIVLEVYVRCLRPKSHYLAKGDLSGPGRKYRYPAGWDLSNVVKLVEDALKGKAFLDDSDIIGLHAYKRWVSNPDDEGTFVTMRTVALAPSAQRSGNRD